MNKIFFYVFLLFSMYTSAIVVPDDGCEVGFYCASHTMSKGSYNRNRAICSQNLCKPISDEKSK